MIITPTEKINLEIIPEILNMLVYFCQECGYIPLVFFTELGILEEDIKAILGINDLSELNLLKVQIDEQDAVVVVSYILASKLISQLAVISQYSVFASISKKLFLKSIETGAVTIDDFAEDFRGDSGFWQSKINNLEREVTKPKLTLIRPHPQVDFTTIARLDDEEIEAYLDINPTYISYKVTQFLCNCNKPITDDIWKNYLLKCLYFHNRELEYSYFLYHLLIKDESVCLLVQTLLTDWMKEGRFCLDIPQ